MRAYTCDICGAREEQTLLSHFLPEQWATLTISLGNTRERRYELCPMCMPPVEGEPAKLKEAKA